MWKDYFYFSRGQRNAIVLLLILIAVAFVLDVCLPFILPPPVGNSTGFLNEVEVFRKTLLDRDSLIRVARQQLYEKKYEEQFRRQDAIGESGHKLFAFDPNTIDSAAFVRLGLKSFVASNILKYRAKGGKFRVAADFSKVYGILPGKFAELEPYITIKTIPANVDTISRRRKETKREIVVDLNSADTVLLMQVKGIGRGYAKGILRFRKLAGGFVSVNQLAELYRMTPENLERIRPYCRVNTALVQKINVNTASVDRLNAHPYISFYQAKAIYELRRHKGRLKKLDELTKLPELTAQDLEKLAPYLSFE
ncbi:MAG TPA: helix-hairpin-helix domain-containing protein [Paludibacter sp.]|nr:helix-hairpin-helix domain-containing protein [Paludibacter sp.]